MAASRWRWAVGAAVAVLVFGGLRPSAFAQQETVELRLKLAAGEALAYTASAVSDITFELPGARHTGVSRIDGREVHRVMDVAADGIAQIEVVLEELRAVTDGRAEEPLDEPKLLRVRPNGQIVDGDTGVLDFPFALPDRPVRVGDRWTRRIPIQEEGISGEAVSTWTLAGVDRAGETVARLTSRLTGSVSAADLGPMPPGAQTRVRGTIGGGETAAWSVDRGRLLRYAGEITMDIVIDVTMEGRSLQGRLRMRIASQRDATMMGVPPAVAPDFLIAPGKAVGNFALEQPAADLTNRLGQPSSIRPAEGDRPGTASWADMRLTAYLDPADSTRLLGLSTSHRRYRTDKGIGFGSSQGAVLFAYGAPPSSVDVVLPGVGGMHYLVYDELGVAFGITADRQHAESGPGHAPLRAVDGVVVFAPGLATRIITAP